MHFQVRTDNHIQNSEALSDGLRSEVESALFPKFEGRIRRVEIYFQDMNSHKRGTDIRCAIEVNLAGHQPIAVSDSASSLDAAASGAIDKLTKTLDRTIGRIEDRQGRVSQSGEPT
ncbi:MAG: HPF/RaiA family ribosome-associated protein [Isosphaeraceae bacterium]